MKNIDCFYDMIDDYAHTSYESSTYLLTKPLRKLLEQIKECGSVSYGYEELITNTIRTGIYNEVDKDWLNVVRRKWINHLKKEKADSLFIKDIIKNTKSW